MDNETTMVELAKAIGRLEGKLTNGICAEIAATKALAQKTNDDLHAYMKDERRKTCYFLEWQQEHGVSAVMKRDTWRTVAAVCAVVVALGAAVVNIVI